MRKNGVIITGGAKRVGAAIAMHFARNGYDVALHYHRSQKEAARVKKDIEKLGAQCEVFAHDVSDIAGIAAFMTKIRKAMPQCTALINNASIFERAEFLQTDEKLFDRQFTVNFKAPFFLTQAFAKSFGKGCVVNVLDTDTVKTQGAHIAYLLSKKALAEFTIMAARALGPKVRVNGLCPGIVLPSNELDQAYIDRLSPTLPLRRTATLAEISEAAQFFVENGGITGQLIFVDGGQHLL